MTSDALQVPSLVSDGGEHIVCLGSSLNQTEFFLNDLFTYLMYVSTL